ncbi:hypothetical protein CAPTEDRAFT_202963 [Capitella teleta]|uniref:EGF-like domain-containing protein n=1 Tax=Capitella teleta TaxID=283909 RepID=R7VFZ2_CAPTE|nr:hypothetical protein CAPTEDRAFT_228840 [Capitella teleta]ELU17549.1 hypothetical protein CAPTEDRAFT_202963 [Capitella teleta]|eukprot:ELU03513.1 hypothetical protein CAPTEDRAFT_228840 [Capitella teleta]
MKQFIVLAIVISVAFGARIKRSYDTVDHSENAATDINKPHFEVADSSNDLYDRVAHMTCDDSPCENGGTCSESEDPYKWGYFCICPPNYGGRTCEVDDPCKTRPCTQEGAICRRSITTAVGRFCYDKDFKPLE